MKEPVIRVVTMDGVVTKRIAERRVVYTKRDGSRYVQDQWKRHYPLSSENEYIYAWWSIPKTTLKTTPEA